MSDIIYFFKTCKIADILKSCGKVIFTHILNCKFSQETALQGIKKIVAVGEKFDLVLLDPPRQGCADVIPYLPETGARTVIYISCDPATLSRDLLLLKGHGYVVDKMKMIDMFPQTHHMETMVKLLKL